MILVKLLVIFCAVQGLIALLRNLYYRDRFYEVLRSIQDEHESKQ